MPQKQQSWLQEALLRSTQQTPWFFRLIMKVGIVCTSAGTGLLLLLIIPNFKGGLWVPGFGSNLLIAGVVMAAVSKFATTTPQDLPNNQPNPIPKGEEIDDQKHDS